MKSYFMHIGTSLASAKVSESIFTQFKTNDFQLQANGFHLIKI